jgi:hypothetical protein
MTAAVKCVPTPAESSTCSAYLDAELELLTRAEAVVVLGHLAAGVIGGTGSGGPLAVLADPFPSEGREAPGTTGKPRDSGAGGGGGGGGYDALNLGTISDICGGTLTGTVTGAQVVAGTCSTSSSTSTSTTTSTACLPTTITTTVTQTLASTPEFGSGGLTMLSGVAAAFALLTLMALRRRESVASSQ